ncbi:WXG100 family type VII secretion target [Succinimonas sp.]|uniref:WXG100 family type VII secretion target n=1 Tax=Succinimonas sp. TaxID=1936151 RepID=UPI00386A796A
MAGVHATPEELDRFTGTLESYLNTVESETDHLKSAFAELGDSWQDQQRQSFEEKFQQLINAFSCFKEDAEEQIPYLRQLAEDLRTYLSR